MKYFVFILLVIAAYQGAQSWFYNYDNGIEAETRYDQALFASQFNEVGTESKMMQATSDKFNAEANLHYLDVVLLCIAFGIIICWVEIIRNFWYDQMIIMVNIKTWIARRKNNKSALTEFKEIEAL